MHKTLTAIESSWGQLYEALDKSYDALGALAKGARSTDKNSVDSGLAEYPDSGALPDEDVRKSYQRMAMAILSRDYNQSQILVKSEHRTYAVWKGLLVAVGFLAVITVAFLVLRLVTGEQDIATVVAAAGLIFEGGLVVFISRQVKDARESLAAAGMVSANLLDRVNKQSTFWDQNFSRKRE